MSFSNESSDSSHNSSNSSNEENHLAGGSSENLQAMALLPITNMSLVETQDGDESRPSSIVNRHNCEFDDPPCYQAFLNKLIKIQADEMRANSRTTASELPEEDKKYLKEVLSSCFVDSAVEMRKYVMAVDEIKTNPCIDVEKCEELLEEIIDQVCSLDMAILFYQLGGLEAVRPLLSHKHHILRAMAANIISECCQNNPYCKSLSAGDNVLCPLIELVANEADNNVKFRSISAISAIIRDNPQAIERFRKLGGFELLQKALTTGNEKIVIKTSFLIMAISTLPSTIVHLVEAGVIESLISLARLSDGLTAEYHLRALLALLSNSDAAVKECVRVAKMEGQCGLFLFLERKISEKCPDEAYLDVVDCAERIYNLIKPYKD